MSKPLKNNNAENYSFKNLEDEDFLKLNESGRFDDIMIEWGDGNFESYTSPSVKFMTSVTQYGDCSFNINYHTIRFHEELSHGTPWGAQFHLLKVIEYMSIKLIKDHCE